MKRIALFALLALLFPMSGFCLTRADVIRNAQEYAAYEWVPSTANLQDVKRYVAGSTVPVPNASDGIDDRMGVVLDLNSDSVINVPSSIIGIYFRGEFC